MIYLGRFISTKPITFRHGDIVEVQVSFAMLPLREKKFKLSLILRSISLLDATYSQACVTLTTHNNINSMP